jgi:hypothetical protein
MSGTPARISSAAFDNGRPESACNVVAAGGDCHRKTAVAFKPVRCFGHQRAEGCCGAKADQKMHQIELPQRGGIAGAKVTDQHKDDADRNRCHDAVAVRELTHHDPAGSETKHGTGEGQEAAPRVAPKSACTVGITTTTDHIPTLPMDPMIRATASLTHAARESGVKTAG